LLRKINDLEKKAEILLEERNNMERIKTDLEKKFLKHDSDMNDVLKKLNEKEEMVGEQSLKINQV
jgi:hypothetical protein